MIDLPTDNTRSDPSDATILRTRASRKNLLLTANIEAGALKTSVRIRNLSESGAMIDGAALPEVGTTLILRRVEIEIGAKVVWRASGRCGIKFDGTASVDEWITGIRRSARMEERSQARVDAIQAAIRSGDLLSPDDGPATTLPVAPGLLDNRIAEELAYVRRMLDSVGDELTEDPIILQRHSRALQNLDAACQMLGHLGAVVGSQDRVGAVAAITMQELRARLL